jgi:hypothetical protein
MHSKYHLLSLLVAAFLTFPATGNAQDRGDISAIPANLSAKEDQTTKIRFLLSAHHQLPDRLTFQSVSEDPAAILREIVSAGPEKRVLDRCLEALAYWPNKNVHALYGSLLRDPSLAQSSQHRLLLLMAKTFPADAMDAIEPFLADNTDRQLRLTAIHALGSMETPEAQRRLAKLGETSQDALIMNAVTRASRSIR